MARYELLRFRYVGVLKKLSYVKSSLRVYLAVLLTCAFFGISFARTTPLFWGQDEETHFGRVYELAQGHLRATNLDQGRQPDRGYGGQIPAAAAKLIDFRNHDIVMNYHFNKAGVRLVDDPVPYQVLGGTPINSAQASYSFTNTAIYAPVAYAPYLPAMAAAKGLDLTISQTVYLLRLAGLLFFLAVIAYVLYVLRETGWKWLFVACLLLPTVVYQASVITADVVIISLGMLILALFTKACLLGQKLTKVELAVLLASGITLPVAKVTYVVISLLILFIPAASIPIRWPRILKYGAVAGALLAAALWNVYVHAAANVAYLTAVEDGKTFNLKLQLASILHTPSFFILDVLRTVLIMDNAQFEHLMGALGASGIVAPATSTVLSAAALFIGVVYCRQAPRAPGRMLLLLSLATIGCFLSIYGTFYLTYTGVGAFYVGGLQGRYFVSIVPLLLLSTVLACYKLGIINPTEKPQALAIRPSHAIVALSALSLCFASVKLHYIIWG